MHPNVYSSTMNNSQIMERAQMTTNWWIDKDVVCINTMEYYLVIKKNEILPFATMWMELECILLREMSQLEEEMIWFHLYVEFKKQNKCT